MRIHSLSAEQALASLNSSAAGLDATEAARRLAEYGANHLEEVERQHLLLRFAQEFTHFFAIILWIGALLAFVAEHFDPGQGMARLGVAIVGVVIINGIFSFWQEYKAERAVEALRQLLPQKVKALRAGEIVGLLASELVPGDIVLLEEGDFVPADCRLTEVFGLRVNLSTVTGESLAKARTAEPSSEESPLQARNVVLAGTSVVSGQGRGVVYATGMRTEFGRIAHLTQTAGETVSPLQREIARLSRIVAGLATGMGVLLFFAGQAMGLPTWENLLFAIGIIVANVPEGLLPTVTLSLAMATQRMARRNALVRHLPAVEALGSTTVICSDKTGTLTQNRMSVQRLWIGGAFMPRSDLPTRAHVLQEHRQLFINAALCHNLKAVEEAGRQALLGDPMEIALAEIGREIAGDLAAFSRIDEIPFDTDRKRMSVLAETPDGRMLYCKGALESVLTSCRFILLDDNFASIVAAIEEGRAVFENIRKFLTYILSSNIPELVPYLAFVLFRIPLPLTIIQILAVDLGTDMLPALALGAEKPDPAVMQRPPRAPNERLLSWGLIARAYLFLGVLEAAAAMLAFFFVLDAAGWHYGQLLDRFDPVYLQATSACLATIVVMQVINVFLCRHPRRSLLACGFGGNGYLWLGIVAELAVIVLILYTPSGNWLFGTAPIGGTTWLLAIACAALMCVLEELRKLSIRRTAGA